jgi:hypothetical protein
MSESLLVLFVFLLSLDGIDQLSDTQCNNNGQLYLGNNESIPTHKVIKYIHS